MERKYYMRGLGIGVAVTAIIMGMAASGGKEMTDQEIIARAKELGMVENTVLSDLEEEEPEESADSGEDSGVVEEDGEEDGGVQETEREASEETDAADATGTRTGLDTGVAAEDVEPEDNGLAEENGSDVEEEKDPADETVDSEENRSDTVRDGITSAEVRTITVNSGDGSHTVAKKLADAGVVTSADHFDEFLCAHGYDKKLRTGTFSIPADAGDEQIARIVTGME